MTEQEQREKVIKELSKFREELRTSNSTTYASATRVVRRMNLIDDALALLKAQEPRVMTWKEAQAIVNEGPFIIFEVRDSTGSELDFGVLVNDVYEMSDGSVLTVCDFWMLADDYGKRFRLWTSRPTEEQREAVPWQV